MKTAPGTTDWPAKTPVRIGTAALIVLILGFGSWGVLANIAGAIVAAGRIEVEQNRQVVRHPDGGVVSAIHVGDGDYVKKGDRLIALDATQMQSRLNVVEAQLFEMLAHISRLEAERDGADTLSVDPLLRESALQRPALQNVINAQEHQLRANHVARSQALQQLAKRKEHITLQLRGIRTQQDALRRQIGFVQDEIALGSNSPTQPRPQTNLSFVLHREIARLQGLLGVLATQAGEHEARRIDTEIEHARLQMQRKEDALTQLRDLQNRTFELRQDRFNLLNKLSRLDIIAPVSGQVFGLTAFVEHSVIDPANPFLFIIPDDRPLMITGQIDPLNIDEVFRGQDVTVRFATFDRNTTPEVFGTINKISGDVFTNEMTGRTFYRVEVQLNEGEIARLGTVALMPGMPVDTFIQTGERSPLAYLIKPLSDYFNRAFRET
ncbi:HlyD family type I secretion periplasmic adaptor subunit [Litoreibacter sp.]|nr:HlyD family type I secretion periplasmic adaptor subunit [Litoreibacter sp.]